MIYIPLYIDFEGFKHGGEMNYRVLKPCASLDEAQVELNYFALVDKYGIEMLFDCYKDNKVWFFIRYEIPDELRWTNITNLEQFSELYMEFLLASSYTAKDIEYDEVELYSIEQK